MKIGVLGAGISGLSIAKMLSNGNEVEILERDKSYGGIAKTKNVEGVAYHKIGGHCFNSKHQDVLDFVFGQVLPESEWHSISRDAVIKIFGQEVTYPIEFAIKQLHQIDEQLALDITKDFLNTNDDGNYLNLEEWFRKKFGDTLAETYFLPYNSKIWNRKPSEMSHEWVEGKLPIPNKNSFFNGLLNNANDKMPHSSFYYPNSNDQKTFIDCLAKDLAIVLDYDVKTVERIGDKWVVNSDKVYDILISTLPLNILPKLLNAPKEILDHAGKLRYNKVTTMLWETMPTKRTWTYVPDRENLFHRYIHIGNFFNPAKNFSITEVVGERSYEEMVENGAKDPFLLRPVDYNVSDHAYVVFDENYSLSTNRIKDYLKEINLFTLGRFGEWEYYNMDICIKSALDMAAQINLISQEAD